MLYIIFLINSTNGARVFTLFYLYTFKRRIFTIYCISKLKKLNAKLTSGFFIFQLFSCFFSFVDSIIKLNQWIFEHTNQAPGNHNARVTSGCLWIWLSFSYPPACFITSIDQASGGHHPAR